mgnify:CR=1 FL=1
MILQALTDYYEALAQRGMISRPGWARARVSYALELDGDGGLLQVYPLKQEIQVGNKLELRPMELELPAPAKRTVGIASNLLWDNPAYLLGMDGKDKPQRARRCFAAAGELHRLVLGGLEDPFARAICRHFDRWNPAEAPADSRLEDCMPDLLKGVNLVFLFRGGYPSQNPAIAKAWQAYYDQSGQGQDRLRCLVTGEEAEPMSVHPAIKGVQGAQSSGAALVSFNAPAFCSYGREQNLNAPVGKYASFAYTTALNHLLSDRRHVKRFGDTTLVYWAQDAEPAYQDVFDLCLDGGDEDILTDTELDEFMGAISRGEPANWEGVRLKPQNPFYILGLAPNAARLAVRFFFRDDFGYFIRNIQRHYDDADMAADGRSKRGHIPLWLLLRETVNQKSSDKKASPQMSGDMLRAVLTGCPYPATLYQQTQLRIRAEREITRGRAAIIKAYLSRNTKKEEYRGALKVELNEGTTYQPYVLGRLFSVAEAIQERASGVTTIKDKYFSSACATPAVVFPMVLDLADKHLKKLDGGIRTYYAKQLGELTAKITQSYPPHHNLYDQGIFQLGYYHQTQKRFEKKEQPQTGAGNEETKGDITNA